MTTLLAVRITDEKSRPTVSKTLAFAAGATNMFLTLELVADPGFDILDPTLTKIRAFAYSRQFGMNFNYTRVAHDTTLYHYRRECCQLSVIQAEQEMLLAGRSKSNFIASDDGDSKILC